MVVELSKYPFNGSQLVPFKKRKSVVELQESQASAGAAAEHV